MQPCLRTEIQALFLSASAFPLLAGRNFTLESLNFWISDVTAFEVRISDCLSLFLCLESIVEWSFVIILDFWWVLNSLLFVFYFNSMQLIIESKWWFGNELNNLALRFFSSVFFTFSFFYFVLFWTTGTAEIWTKIWRLVKIVNIVLEKSNLF